MNMSEKTPANKPPAGQALAPTCAGASVVGDAMDEGGEDLRSPIGPAPVDPGPRSAAEGGVQQGRWGSAAADPGGRPNPQTAGSDDGESSDDEEGLSEAGLNLSGSAVPRADGSSEPAAAAAEGPRQPRLRARGGPSTRRQCTAAPDPGVILIRDTAMVDMMREKYGHEFNQ